MIIFYRYSDSSQPGSINKNKLENATKEACLENFLKAFPKTEHDIIIVADNVNDSTYDYLITKGTNVVRTNYKSGAISFLFSVKCAITMDISDDEIIYFVEDDYLHTLDSSKYIEDGLKYGDYCTLYDHPDKYINQNESYIYVSKLTHWRTTISTTMTFATTKKILNEDWDIYLEHCKTGYPYDHEMFISLNKKKRVLVSSIPGYSTHIENAWLTPLRDWANLL